MSSLAITTIGGVIVAVFTVVIVGFWRWTALKIMELNIDLEKLRQRLDDHDKESADRLEWLRAMDEKLNVTVMNTAEIKGTLKTYMEQHAHRKD